MSKLRTLLSGPLLLLLVGTASSEPPPGSGIDIEVYPESFKADTDTTYNFTLAPVLGDEAYPESSLRVYFEVEDRSIAKFLTFFTISEQDGSELEVEYVEFDLREENNNLTVFFNSSMLGRASFVCVFVCFSRG